MECGQNSVGGTAVLDANGKKSQSSIVFPQEHGFFVHLFSRKKDGRVFPPFFHETKNGAVRDRGKHSTIITRALLLRGLHGASPQTPRFLKKSSKRLKGQYDVLPLVLVNFQCKSERTTARVVPTETFETMTTVVTNFPHPWLTYQVGTPSINATFPTAEDVACKRGKK